MNPLYPEFRKLVFLIIIITERAKMPHKQQTRYMLLLKKMLELKPVQKCFTKFKSDDFDFEGQERLIRSCITGDDKIK